jgi:hypothetical protein
MEPMLAPVVLALALPKAYATDTPDQNPLLTDEVADDVAALSAAGWSREAVVSGLLLGSSLADDGAPETFATLPTPDDDPNPVFTGFPASAIESYGTTLASDPSVTPASKIGDDLRAALEAGAGALEVFVALGSPVPEVMRQRGFVHDLTSWWSLAVLEGRLETIDDYAVERRAFLAYRDQLFDPVHQRRLVLLDDHGVEVLEGAAATGLYRIVASRDQIEALAEAPEAQRLWLVAEAEEDACGTPGGAGCFFPVGAPASTASRSPTSSSRSSTSRTDTAGFRSSPSCWRTPGRCTASTTASGAAPGPWTTTG